MTPLRTYTKLRPIAKKWQDKPDVIVLPDGRELCNLATAGGLRIYHGRIRTMVLRQDRRCCLEGHCPDCPGRLEVYEADFEHEDGRTSGHRDDRIVLPDGTWINGAAHRKCNSWKGSRRIAYNEKGAA